MDASYDYEIIESLHSSARSLVYRARSTHDRSALIVKILNQNFPSFQEVAQFKREYAIAQRCGDAGVVRPLALRRQAGRWTIIQEDIGGDSLNKLLRGLAANADAMTPAALPLADFFEIALQLCAALEVVHANSVIHKDINPANLVWNAERRRLQLIDFGISCELEQETATAAHPRTLEGTLHYMAPEQTGRMNRVVDYRADYYAIGATLYELLTGQPPFAAADAMELVHCHLARAPDWSLPPLENLPGPLLAVLQRLLEKNAEQRYQSLHGLKRDLQRCQALARPPGLAGEGDGDGEGEHGAGRSDHSGRLLIPQKLYGRVADVATLLDAFERASAGPSEMLLLAGYSGIGKSAVVHEVHKPIAARRAFFISGKFDQYRRDLPYAPLVEAFRGLVRQLLGEPEAQLRQWAATLREALGAGLGVMVELIPELALVVGATEAATALAPVEARHRLHRLLRQFVRVFASAAHPLVLFVDDLQWADAATLTMLELFICDPQQRHLLLLGAYRDNEVDAAHPLAALGARLQQAGVRLTTLTLGPLSETQVAQLIADTLGAPAAACAALTALCYRKTGGNPFFLNQFLQAIHDAGHLRYHFELDGWRWDMAALERANYTDNVVDLMLAKIALLPRPTRHLLQLAAALGNRVGLATLATVAQRSPQQTQRHLWPALQAGLIHPLDQRYKYLDADADGADIGYRFLHDRVQQAAYAVADPDAHRRNHLHIGRQLLRHAPAAALDEQVFAIAEQLNAGRELIDAPDERLQLAALNCRAGLKARAAAAFQATLRHMRVGLELLPQRAWDSHRELYLDLQLGAAEAAYLCGEFDAAEAIYPLLPARCATPLQHTRCIAVQARQYQLQGRLADAIAIQRGGLALLGIEVGADDAALQAGAAAILADAERLSAGRGMDELTAAPEMADPAARAAMEMMQGLWMASYYAGQQHLSRVMALSMTRLSLQQGNSDFTAVAYISYTAILGARAHDGERAYRFGAMALALAKRRDNQQARTLTGLMFGALIQHWTRPLRSCDALYDDAFHGALAGGDPVNLGVVAAVRATDRLIWGLYLPELLRAGERDLALMRANGQRDLADCLIAGALQPAKCLMGLTRRGDSYDDDGFSEAAFLAEHGGSRLYQAYFYQGKIRNAYLFDCADAEALAGHLDVVAQILRDQSKVPETTFYTALIWLRALRRAPRRGDAGAVLARAQAMLAQLAGWAAQGPDNYAAKHLLARAEYARQRQHAGAAARYYRLAIEAARDGGHGSVEALANELCGEFWLEQGQPRVAGVFLHDALAQYRQWGADGKVAQLGARHGALLRGAAGHPAGAMRLGDPGAITVNGSGAANSALDLASVLKATHALSNEIGLRNVLQRLLTIARENSGAQLARLLLLNEQVWRLEGDIGTDSAAVLQQRPLELDGAGDAQFPLSLLRYVARSGAEIIEDRIGASPRFGADPYVLAQRPRSVMCLPIKQAAQVVGMLYLENNLAEASFTAERVEFLRILGAQAMISIAHARLHDRKTAEILGGLIRHRPRAPARQPGAARYRAHRAAGGRQPPPGHPVGHRRPDRAGQPPPFRRDAGRRMGPRRPHRPAAGAAHDRRRPFQEIQRLLWPPARRRLPEKRRRLAAGGGAAGRRPGGALWRRRVRHRAAQHRRRGGGQLGRGATPGG
ncbi:putative ATPase/serine/threonine protein kinase [Janthinobacterium sp. CG_23.3]